MVEEEDGLRCWRKKRRGRFSKRIRRAVWMLARESE